MNRNFDLDLLFKNAEGICLKTLPKRSHNQADQADDARLFALAHLLAKRAAHHDFMHCAHSGSPQGESPHDVTH